MNAVTTNCACEQSALFVSPTKDVHPLKVQPTMRPGYVHDCGSGAAARQLRRGTLHVTIGHGAGAGPGQLQYVVATVVGAGIGQRRRAVLGHGLVGRAKWSRIETAL